MGAERVSGLRRALAVAAVAGGAFAAAAAPAGCGRLQASPCQGEGQSRPPRFGELELADVLPTVVEREPARRPRTREAEGLGGRVVVQALVCVDGRVRDTRLVRGFTTAGRSAVDSVLAAAFDREAIRAVRRYRFTPALRGGAPLALWVAVPVDFPTPIT